MPRRTRKKGSKQQRKRLVPKVDARKHASKNRLAAIYRQIMQ